MLNLIISQRMHNDAEPLVPCEIGGVSTIVLLKFQSFWMLHRADW